VAKPKKGVKGTKKKAQGSEEGHEAKGASEEWSELKSKELELHDSLYAQSTSAARGAVRQRVVDFNKRFFGQGVSCPVFVSGMAPDGQQVSAAFCARLFFAKLEGLKKSTIKSIKSHLNMV